MEDHQYQDSGKRAFEEVCFVAYKGHILETEIAAKQPVLLIAILDTAYRLSILVDPSWPEFVSAEDRAYMDALLGDLKPRAQFDARGLFEQLAGLDFGPIITSKLKSFNDEDYIQNLIPSHFLRIV